VRGDFDIGYLTAAFSEEVPFAILNALDSLGLAHLPSSAVRVDAADILNGLMTAPAIWLVNATDLDARCHLVNLSVSRCQMAAGVKEPLDLGRETPDKWIRNTPPLPRQAQNAAG
jgi:hypothetical protein